jgi:hypothetical protein
MTLTPRDDNVLVPRRLLQEVMDCLHAYPQKKSHTAHLGWARPAQDEERQQVTSPRPDEDENVQFCRPRRETLRTPPGAPVSERNGPLLEKEGPTYLSHRDNGWFEFEAAEVGDADMTY